MDFEKRISYLKTILVKAELQLKNSDNKVLSLSKSHNSYQFCYYDENRKRIYIKKNEQKLAQQLAQNKYNLELVKEINPQIKLLKDFKMKYKPNVVSEVFNKQPTPIRELVTPYETEYLSLGASWAAKSYKTKPDRGLPPQYTTDNGEKVRSKSEVIIANALKNAGLYYRYECQRYLKNYGFIYPDFIVLHPVTHEEIIYEHFGMMDNPEYVRTFMNKLHTYTANGYIMGHNLVCTFETKDNPLSSDYLNTVIRQYFQEEPK